MEDRQIVDLYLMRSEDAISETEKKYGRYCHYIAYCILENDEDAKEIVNDTYLKTWNTVPPNRPDPLKTYVGMITRQLSLDRYEEKHAQKRGGETALVLEELAECIPSSKTAEDTLETHELTRMLNEFLDGLSTEERRVFLCRYWYLDPVKDIAKRFSFGESKVKMILKRTREKLLILLEKEGITL